MRSFAGQSLGERKVEITAGSWSVNSFVGRLNSSSTNRKNLIWRGKKKVHVFFSPSWTCERIYKVNTSCE